MENSTDDKKSENMNSEAKYSEFKDALKNAAEKFKKIPKNESIKIISHLDSDGICAAAILINALMKENYKYSLSVLPAITEEHLDALKEENEKYFVFVDLGSSNLDSIAKILDSKEIFILDHHTLQSTINHDKITHVNPHMFGIDGSVEIAGSGVVFLFTSYLTKDKNIGMSRIAVVGAIGDVQEHDGFKKLNQEILEIALENKLVEVKKGLKFFGIQTKPIHKLLQYSSDVLIPGITGSESSAIQFLLDLGINPKLNLKNSSSFQNNPNNWKKIADLNEDEKKKLIAGIIMKRANEKNPDAIFANAYLLIGEQEDSPFRDAKEFSTLLNSCGRLNKASIGIGACLNDKKMKMLAMQNLLEYRKEIVNAMNWYKENINNSDKIIQNKKYMIINAGEDVLPTMIGTLGSILSKSTEMKKNMFILSLAKNYDGTTKISLRISGNPENVNLQSIITQIIEKINHGTSGGHSFASGAVIDSDFEEPFIKAAIEILENTVLEEMVEDNTAM